MIKKGQRLGENKRKRKFERIDEKEATEETSVAGN